MTPGEWESLCDGCGKCCLLKVEDADSGQVHYTDAACRLLDLHGARCTRYALRTLLVDDCLQLTPERVGELRWLPPTCAYRLVAEGKDLPEWHHLISADPEAVHRAGASVRDWAVSEYQVRDIEDHILQWLP